MITELSQEEKRVKIAEAFGWTAKEDEEGYWRAVSPNGVFAHDLWMSERNVWHSGIPDYFSDLNAMHVAEKVLTHEQCIAYHEEIDRRKMEDFKIDGEGREYPAQDFWFHATADQRAEAFGQTLKLW